MEGFTITCNQCQTKSEFESPDERVTEDIKIFIYGLTRVGIVCDKCGQGLDLS